MERDAVIAKMLEALKEAEPWFTDTPERQWMRAAAPPEVRHVMEVAVTVKAPIGALIREAIALAEGAP